MNGTLFGVTQQLKYLITHITTVNVIDMTLVSVLFFILFQALYQTRALQLLRGVIIAATLGGGLLFLLPLTTLNWLVRFSLLAGAIALPILFQDELRRLLVRLGQVGKWRASVSNYELFKQSLLSAISQLALRHTGALIVLEGQTLIEDVISTGVRMQAQVITSELLQTIFSPRTPLHDGAVVVRAGRLEAAACILPVQTEGLGNPQLGTRHRAAMGLSVKVADALVIIVSEETGWISVAYGGKLYLNLTLEQLEAWINRFAEQVEHTEKFRWSWLRGGGIRQTLINVLISVLIAVISWLVVIYQTNPPTQIVLQGVALTVEPPGENIMIMSAVPNTVNVQVQTTKDHSADLTNASVRAVLDLKNQPVGTHSLPIQVATSDPFVQTVSVKPRTLNVILEMQVSRVFTPTVTLTDLSSLPAGYAASDVRLDPPTIQVIGPSSAVDRLTSVRVDIAIRDRRGEFQETVVPVPVDNMGHVVDGVTLVPEQIIATIPIRRTFFTQEIGVQAVLDRKGFSSDYEIKAITINPATVSLTGAQSDLANAGDFLSTAPISLAGLTSDLTTDIPLITPEGVKVLDEHGEAIHSVQVKITIVPMTAYLVVSRPLTIVGQDPANNYTLSESDISVLLVGPKILLEDVSKNPGLVLVKISAASLTPGVYTLPLEISAPIGVQAQGFPKEIQVLVEPVKK